MARPNGNPRGMLAVRLGEVGKALLDADVSAATTPDLTVTRADVIRAALRHWATLGDGTRRRLAREAAKAERGPKQ